MLREVAVGHHSASGDALALKMRRVRVAFVVMGFSGLVAEILLLRELMVVFSGNELSIGIVLANWLVLEAVGAYLPGRMAAGHRRELETYTLATVLFSLALPAALFLTRILKNILGIAIGESVGLLPVVYASFLVLLPVSTLHGALFSLGCRLDTRYAGERASSTGTVYVYETVGTMVGGVVCTYLIIPHLHAFQASIGLALLNVAACLVLFAPVYRTGGWRRRAILIALSVGALAFGYLILGGQADRIHTAAVRAQWKDHNVVHNENSAYGNLTVIENEGQYIFFLDGRPTILTPIPDRQAVEEFVHLPLLAHPDPSDLLVLSGGAGGVIHEALKHPSVATLEYAELDPLLLSLLRRFQTPLTEAELGDARVEIRPMDGRLLLRTTPTAYDVIFVGISEPSSLQTNRFFTKAFASLAQDRLKEGGILVLGVPGALSFVSEPLRDLNSCIYHTLRSVFAHVRVMPGDSRTLFLSSDAPAVAALDTATIAERLRTRQIGATGRVPWHIENMVHPGWQDWFLEVIADGTERINRDVRPLGLFLTIAHWSAVHTPTFGRFFMQFGRLNLGIVSVGLTLPLLLDLILRRRAPRLLPMGISGGIPFAIAATGFAGMIVSNLAIFAFQFVHGYVFSWIGLLVAAFMAGAAGGARVTTVLLSRTGKDGRLFIGRRLFVALELLILSLSLALALVFSVIPGPTSGQSATGPLRMVFLVLQVTCGFLTGSQFPVAYALMQRHAGSGRTAGLLYASDLVGGWMGGVIGAVVLLPVLGLGGTCVTVGLVKVLSFVVTATRTDSDL